MPPNDTGVPPNDTGVAPDDTGVIPDDTGVVPTDTGATGKDAGSDAGPSTMTCTTPGQVDCGSGCTALRSDPMNCGMCGHACASGEVTMTDANNCGGCGIRCGYGTCNGGTCVCSSPGGMMCSGTATVCTNTRLDHDHCGSCTTACGAMQFCADGACHP